MSKLPSISGKTAIAAFCRLGYDVLRQKGSHVRLTSLYRKPLTIPNHSVLGKGLLRKLLRDSEISVDDFLKLLRK